MKHRYVAPRAAQWIFEILPYFDEQKYLVEDAPVDENRAMYQLIKPLRDWLLNHEHTMEIDRGDFGEGAEHFNLTLFTKTDAEDFKALCESFKHD